MAVQNTGSIYTGNYGSYLHINYEFTTNTTARTWSLSTNMYIFVPKNYTFGSWSDTKKNSANLVGSGIGSISGGSSGTSHWLAGYSTSGKYNSSGSAPSVTVTWAFNVNSSWGGYQNPTGSVKLTGPSIGGYDSLPTASLSATDIKPTSATFSISANDTISYVKMDPGSVGGSLFTSYPDLSLKVLSDGSVWARVFNHDNQWGTILFSSSDALNTQSATKYSRLNLLANSLKDSSGKFEFMLTYPTQYTTYNRWKQTNAPQNEKLTETSSGTSVTGYQAVSIAWSGNYWGGLEYCNGGYALCDGSTGHSNWWYALASYKDYENGIPGPTVVTYRQQELWVRIPGAVGQVKSTNSNSSITISDLDPESTYYVCTRTTNAAGAGYSNTISIYTPTDQARAYIKKDGAWAKGKLYIKKDGVWVKSKKVYIKETNSWSIGINN